jgi:hypothetical protein
MRVGEDYEKVFVEPIINAAHPATLASLSPRAPLNDMNTMLMCSTSSARVFIGEED